MIVTRNHAMVCVMCASARVTENEVIDYTIISTATVTEISRVFNISVYYVLH